MNIIETPRFLLSKMQELEKMTMYLVTVISEIFG